MKQFRFTCVSPPSSEELDYILEHEEDITFEEFSKYVNMDYVNEFNLARGINIDEDWGVTFHKSVTLDGKSAYYFKDSAIEHIFY